MSRRVFSVVRNYYADPMQYADTSRQYMRMREIRIPIMSLDTVLAGKAEYLGEGHFSKVYDFGSAKWVMKLDCSNSDPAYEAYADFCMSEEGRSNPYCPRIRLKVKLPNDCTMYIIEKLRPLSYQHDATVENQRRQVRGHEPFQCPDFKRLVMAFGPENMGDMGSRNAMMRDDGQIVHTDPCHRFFSLGAGSDSRFEANSHVRVYEQEKRIRNSGLFNDGGIVFEPLDFNPVQEHIVRIRDIAPMNFDWAFDVIKPKPTLDTNDPLALKRNAQENAHHRHLIERANHGLLRHRRPHIQR